MPADCILTRGGLTAERLAQIQAYGSPSEREAAQIAELKRFVALSPTDIADAEEDHRGR